MKLRNLYLSFSTMLPLSSVIAILILVLNLLPDMAHAQQESPYIPEFSCDNKPFGLNLPKTLPHLMKLGKIRRIDIKETEQWEAYRVTYKDIYFSGLVLGLITFSNNSNRYMISYAEISDTKWAHIAPFKIGDSITLVQQKIGRFTENDPYLEQHYGSEAGDLSFEVSGDKLKKIKYWCYTG